MGRCVRECLIEHCTEAEDVDAMVVRHSQSLFGCHVRRRAAEPGAVFAAAAEVMRAEVEDGGSEV